MTIFRGTGWSFANDPAFSHVSADPKYWDERNERFYKKYNGLNRKHSEWAALVVARQPIKSFTGREWFIPMKEFINEHTQELTVKTPWTDLSNWPVQGTGSDLMKVARISLSNRIRRYKMTEAKPVATVHDSLVTDVPDKLIKPMASLMYEVFQDIPKNVKKLFNHELSVEFPCEVKFGSNLLEMEKLPIDKL